MVNKKIFGFLFVFCAVVFVNVLAVDYNITTCQELQNMSLDLSGNYQLMNNVDCLGIEFRSIGNLTNPFSGVLDGKNKTISNLIINFPESNYTGLFGVASGDVLNISLDSASITGAEFVGVLMGFQDGGTISNSHVSGEVNSYVVDGDVGGLVGQLNSGEINDSHFSGNINAVSGNAIGGLVGFQQSGTTISRSYFSGIIYGEASVGGLVGAQFGGTISSSYSRGNSNIIATGYSVGGLVGWKNNGVILNSYSFIGVNGGNEVGGLVGRQDSGSIENSYSAGLVEPTIGYQGGLLGFLFGGTVVNSYWDVVTSWQPSSNGTEEGKTSGEMMALYTYNFFGGEWNISGGADNLNNGYPYLAWQAGNSSTVWMIPSTKDSFFAGGSGTVGNPYQISSWEELDYVRNNLSAHYVLIANLSAGTEGYSGLGSSWQPIGNHSSYNNEEFSGTFDGMNNTISDVVINLNKYQVALFDSTTASASISNLGLINFNVVGGLSDTATLVGYNSATITNVYARGGSVSGTYSVGGLIGDCGGSGNVISNVWTDISVSGVENVGGIGGDVFQPIINSYSLGPVSGANHVAGIYGGIRDGAFIKNCYSSSAITATNGGFGTAGGGGILGRNDGSVLIENCYFNGTISGDFSGGIAADNSGIIKNCYSNATITGEANGGIAGIQKAGTINNSFSASGMVTSGVDFINGGFVGFLSGVDVGSIKNSGWIKTDETLFAIGLEDSSQLPIENITYNETDESVFYGSLHPIYSSWNFSGVWTEDPLGFPKLKWENFERDMVSPQISFYNDTSNGSLTQNWIFANVSVGDLNLDEVVIYLYNETSLINTSVGNSNFFINFSDLSYGNYFLNASANDTFGNTNYTITYNITLQNPATCSDGIQNQDETGIDCGGSCGVCSAGGGGSGRGVSNYNLTDLQLFDGASKLLRVKDKIIFNVSNQTHTLTLKSFNNQSINITIESTPKNYVINLGQTISVDVTGDGVMDVDVSYEKYFLGSAQIGIRMAKVANTADDVQVDVEDVDGDKSVVGRFFADEEFRAKVLLVVSVVLLILIILFFILILSVFRRNR